MYSYKLIISVEPDSIDAVKKAFEALVDELPGARVIKYAGKVVVKHADTEAILYKWFEQVEKQFPDGVIDYSPELREE